MKTLHSPFPIPGKQVLPALIFGLAGFLHTANAQLIDLKAIVGGSANTSNLVTTTLKTATSGLVTGAGAGGSINLANSNLDARVESGGVVDSLAVAALAAQLFDANGNVNPNVTLGAAGLAGLGDILGIDFCIELGLLTLAPDICDVVTVDPTDPGDGGGDPRDPTDTPPFPDIIISDDILAPIGASSIPALFAQRRIARQAMAIGTADINARLQRFRSGLKPAPGGPAVFQDENSTPIRTSTPYEWELFAQGNFRDREEENFALGQDLDSNGSAGIVGAEHRINETMTVGVALSGVEVNASIDGGLGDTDIEGVIGMAYLSHSSGNFYADVLYAYGALDHDLSRTALNGRTASSEFESDNQLIEFNTGLNFQTEKAVTGPYLTVQYVKNEIDGYTENGATLLNIIFDDQDAESLTSELGWQVSFPQQSGDLVIAPHARVAWVHQYLDDQDAVSGTLRAFPANRITGLSPAATENFGLIGTGLAIQFSEQTTLSLDVEMILSQQVSDFGAVVAFSHLF